jgi:hypothetical protein
MAMKKTANREHSAPLPTVCNVCLVIFMRAKLPNLLFSYGQFVQRNRPPSKMQLLQISHNQQLGALGERRWFVYRTTLIPGPK